MLMCSKAKLRGSRRKDKSLRQLTRGRDEQEEQKQPDWNRGWMRLIGSSDHSAHSGKKTRTVDESN